MFVIFLKIKYVVIIDVSVFTLDEKNYLMANCDLFINPFDNEELAQFNLQIFHLYSSSFEIEFFIKF